MMFQTRLDGASVGGLLNNEEDGCYFWDQVHVISARPWFHVEYETWSNDDEAFLKSIVFCTYPEHLQIFIESNSIKILRVIIATPGRINGSGNWQFDLLESVSRQELSSGENCHEFVLQNGTRYSSSKDKNASIVNKEQLFRQANTPNVARKS